MDKPIKVGDLVLVVKVCCGKRSHYFGVPLTVISITYKASMSCPFCHTSRRGDKAYFDHPELGGAPVAFLKRIPPLKELDDVKKDEEITA